jgi:hypothetical protein
MKSRFLSSFDMSSEDNKGFIEDLNSILGLSKENQKSITNQVVKILSISVSKPRYDLIDELVSKTGLTHIMVVKTINISRFFLRAFNDDENKNDTPELVVADLIDLTAIPENYEKSAIDFISYLLENNLESYRGLVLKNTSAVGVLPVFKSIGSTIELRPIMKNEYPLGTDVDKFKPEISGFIPIVSLAIETDETNSKPTIFQLEPSDVDILINKFESIKKELAILKNHLPK